jgi:Cu-processing system permease protein
VIALLVARDLLQEAASRRWTLGLAAAVTLALVAVGMGLRLEVVDGALAATRLFGGVLDTDIRSVDVALRPLFAGTSWLVFYGGTLFGIAATSDFGPAMLAPGRVEHLLALPVRRWQLLLGTFLGVEALVLGGALYGGGGMALLLLAKTGVWNPGPLLAAAMAAVAFAPVYAVMLGAARLARSAALSAAAGFLLFAAGIVAGERGAIASAFEPGTARAVFLAVTAPLPRLTPLAGAAAALAQAKPVAAGPVLGFVLGAALFAAAVLALAAARFERKDF